MGSTSSAVVAQVSAGAPGGGMTRLVRPQGWLNDLWLFIRQAGSEVEPGTEGWGTGPFG